MSNVIDAKLYSHCRSELSVSSEYAKNPHKTPGEIAEALYNSHELANIESKPPRELKRATAEDLQRAYECGRFAGTKPSELFLRAYHDMLLSLQHDPLAGVVSPSLLGSTGVVPLTIIGPLHDIARHMSNLIVRAKKEVFLATCSWLAGGATTLITDAIRELSRRAGARGEKVVVKVIFDKGNVKQMFGAHQILAPKDYTAEKVKLPAPQDIPHVDMQVVNYHRPMLGTFHSKFLVVDRSVACVSSNNLQDNDNMEMMSRLEGPIVDCLWDTFIVSWHNAMTPVPPCLDSYASNKPTPCFESDTFKALFTEDGKFRLPEQSSPSELLPEHRAGDPHYDADLADEIKRMHSWLSPRKEGETQAQVIARHLNQTLNLDLAPSAPHSDSDLQYFTYTPTAPTSPFPLALANRKPYGNLNHSSLYVPQNECFLSLTRNATSTIFIQTPDLNAAALLPALVDAVKRGVQVTYYVCLGYNDAGELLPGQGGINESVANGLYGKLDTAEERDRLRVHFYVAADQAHPIHNKFKQRSCHVKLLIADGHVAVQGSGNQDTQSWYQSQEVNVMVDSEAVCRSWREGIERSQNTARFGRAREDGCWYDGQGKLAEGSLGPDQGKFPWAKGVVGFLDKVRRTGGA